MEMRHREIFNSLEAIGETFTNQEKIQKILQSLPIEFDSKVMAIEEAKDLRTFEVKELIGSLIAYEKSLMARKEEKAQSSKKNIAFSSKEEDLDRDLSKHEMEKLSKEFLNF